MLQIRNVSVHYGEGESGVVALSRINLDIKPGEFVVALGHFGVSPFQASAEEIIEEAVLTLATPEEASLG